MKVFGVIVLSVILIQAKSELKCYQCLNCPEAKDNDLKQCPPSPGISTTSTTSSSTTTYTDSSTDPSKATTTTTNSESSSSLTDSTTGSDTTTEIGPTHPTSESSSETEATQSPQTSPSTDSTTDRSTITASEESVDSIPELIFLPNEVHDPQMYYYRRARSLRQEETKYSCTHGEIEVNGTTIIFRGCTDEADFCTKNPNVKNCKTCKESKCNSSSAIQISILTLMLFTVLSLTLRKLI